jgi:5-methylcytosine-specific restriction endonuclease McrA
MKSDRRKLEVDHDTPLEAGGSETDGNRVTLCIECHKAKSERENKERAG